MSAKPWWSLDWVGGALDLGVRASPAVARSVQLAAPVFVVAVAVVDELTGSRTTLTALYLLPVAVVAAVVSPARGLAAACIVAALQAVLESETGSRIGPGPALWNALSRFFVYSLVAVLIGVLRERVIAERADAHTDTLTGLPNHRALAQFAHHELARSRRLGTPFAAAFIDVDGLKRINDAQGHGHGDLALVAVARHLAAAVRASDLVARVAGDEFVVLLPDTGSELLSTLADRIGTAAPLGDGSSVGFSVGYACYDAAPSDVDQILRDADREMYRTKRLRG